MISLFGCDSILAQTQQKNNYGDITKFFDKKAPAAQVRLQVIRGQCCTFLYDPLGSDTTGISDSAAYMHI